MTFSSPGVAEVLADYSQRMVEERAKAAAYGARLADHRDEFLLSVGEDAGRFLHGLILAKRPRRVLELGTAYGYSTLFLADAVKRVGGRLTTMEIAGYKQAAARASMEKAGLVDVIDFRLGDAVTMIGEEIGQFDLVLLDIWKDLYVPCLEALWPKLADEGIIAADNMVEPSEWRADVRRYRAAVKALPHVETALLPIGQGIELSVKWAPGNAKL